MESGILFRNKDSEAYMRKTISLVGLLAILAGTMFAHGDDSHFSNKQDVQFKTTNVRRNVYMLQGRGGNIGAIVGPDGILIVDDDYKQMSEKLRDALKAFGSSSPRYILNTHWHGYHTEGNEFFGRESVIVAHAN